MHTARRTLVATGTVTILAAAGVTAAIAADPAPAPPPRIAFLANGIVPADALAAGPIAGQLGAPMYTTQPDALSSAAATGLDDYDPELVIVLGGPVAIHDTVIDQVEAATGLTETADATPAGGIVRAAGGDRFDTAAAVADLLAAYNPAYLPINMRAVDADTVDGKHASAFLAANGTAANADSLDGKDSTEFLTTSDLPSCPADMQEHAGLCIETAARSATTWPDAVSNCGDEDRRLPSPGELVAASNALTWSGFEYTSTLDGTNHVVVSGSGTVSTSGVDSAYRCLTPLYR